MRTRDFFVFLLAVVTLGYIGTVAVPRLPCGYSFPLKAKFLRWDKNLSSYMCNAGENYEILVIDRYNNRSTFLRIPKEEFKKLKNPPQKEEFEKYIVEQY